jgi:molybdenum cofactor biosynthesis protein A
MKPLLDPFGRHHTYLRLSVTDRCNLRCTYCMPPQGISVGPREDVLTFDEIERVSRVFAGLGITKIRLTGGEPLVRKGLPALVERLVRISGVQRIGMTTNGVLLKHHLPALREAGLTHLNISLDTLRPERFEKIALRSHFTDVRAGIDAALATGFLPLKLNVVVMGGINDDELSDFVSFVEERPMNVRFIEYMPFKLNRWNTAAFISFADMKRRLDGKFTLIPVVPSEESSSVGRDFRIPGWRGTISFITSMSEHFCDTCNRLRLTADGSIKSCLFHPAEVNLRGALRDGASEPVLEKMIRSALLLKPARHAPADELLSADNRTMIEIGG